MSDQEINEGRVDRIRSRAYQIWDEAGRPEGRHEEHWHQASADIDAEQSEPDASPMPAPRWTPMVPGGHGGEPAEGDHQTIDDNFKADEQGETGQFADQQHGGSNSGLSSVEPRIFSGDDDGDATYPLNQNRRKGR